MKTTYRILTRELRGYFVSPLAYVITCVFVTINGFMFYNLLAHFNFQCFEYSRYPHMLEQLNLNNMVIRPLFHNMSVIMLLIIPAITMRLLAEERKTGTIELLLTYPIKKVHIVLGKFLGALTMFGIMLGFTALCLAILFIYAKPEIGPIFSGYLGLFLMGGSFIAMGLLFSAITENQVIAAVSTFGLLLFLWLLSWSSTFITGTFGQIIAYISIIEHLGDFAKGIIDTKDVIFYLTFIFMGLFLTQRYLHSLGWR